MKIKSNHWLITKNGTSPWISSWNLGYYLQWIPYLVMRETNLRKKKTKKILDISIDNKLINYAEHTENGVMKENQGKKTNI